MNVTATTKPVVVGIDGSKHALRAAQWAALEAASRDVTLRLVYVIDAVDADSQENIDRAQHALHKVWKAVGETHNDVKLESEIVAGDPAECLVEESRGASMVCVGDRGIHDTPDAPRGSPARSPVAPDGAPLAAPARSLRGPRVRPRARPVRPLPGGAHLVPGAASRAPARATRSRARSPSARGDRFSV